MSKIVESVDSIKQRDGERNDEFHGCFEYGFMNHDSAHKFPAASSISILGGCIKYLGFLTTIRDAAIQARAGMEVVPQRPPESDHMANSLVAMAVREVKRQCRTPRFSAEPHSSVRIADDRLFSSLLRFAAQVMNTMRLMEKRMN